LAEGRQRYGQTTFSFDFQHTNDYGVTSNVTIAAKKLNLSLGGSFENTRRRSGASRGPSLLDVSTPTRALVSAVASEECWKR
jgi:hypothetical protein